MPTDFVVYYLTQPLGIFFQAGLIVIPLFLLRFFFPGSFAPLGFRRLLFAHMAVAVGVFVLAAYSAFTLGRDKLSLGHVQDAEFNNWVAGNSVYLFVLFYVVALVFASLVLVPLCVWLFRFRRASVAAFAAVGVVVALLSSLVSVVMPGNEWGRSHPFELFLSTLASFGLGAIVVCLCFAVGARLPLRVGARHAT